MAKRLDRTGTTGGTGGAVRTRRSIGADYISAGLRELWAAVEQEPVPEEFLSILDMADARRAAPGGGERDGEQA